MLYSEKLEVRGLCFILRSWVGKKQETLSNRQNRTRNLEFCSFCISFLNILLNTPCVWCLISIMTNITRDLFFRELHEFLFTIPLLVSPLFF